MNILLLANSDVASLIALRQLLPSLKNDTLSIWLSSRVGGNTTTFNIHHQMRQLKYLEQGCLDDLNLFLSATPSRSSIISFEQLADYFKVPVQIVNDINAPNRIEELSDLAIDLVISIRYGVIIKESVIGLSNKGIINLHSGILPSYRGVMATFWSMLQEEEEIGTSLHYIDSSDIDAGPIIKISRQKVDYQKSYWFNVLRLYRQGVKDILGCLELIRAEADVQRVLPNIESGKYYSFPNNQDLEKFLSKYILSEAQDIQWLLNSEL